jgi:AraC-like DNA-binding protein
MNHAANLLLTGAKVKLVACELGYANPFHFSAVFRRYFGYPPRELQKSGRRSGFSEHYP